MITFNADTHTYTDNNKILPSVTQVLGLANLYEFVNANLLERAARFGTAVHKATELYDQGKLNTDTLDIALVPYLNGWKKFLRDTQFHVIHNELLVHSDMGYAGTLDRIGLIRGKLTLLDIKTTSVVPKTTALQLAAYKYAFEEMQTRKIDQCLCCQLKPDNYRLVEYNNPSDFFMFCNFLTVYKWSQDNV